MTNRFLFGATLFIFPLVLQGAVLKITRTRHLQFSPGTAGQSSELVLSSSPQSSQFLVTGDPNANIRIILPSGTLNMTGGGQTIGASLWTSNVGTTATLDSTGKLTVFIGATRNTIGNSIAPATFSGSHTLQAKYTSSVLYKSASANHTIQITKSLTLTKLKDLQFPQGYSGDPAHTVPQSDPNAAGFTLLGEASRTFQVILPAAASVILKVNGGGNPDKEIIIDNFTASPYPTGTIPTNGSQPLTIGATRRPLRTTQIDGQYSGQFSVRVVYQ